MGGFLWLHLISFWSFFSMEVGMLMYPAPHDQPLVWARLERFFFLVHLPSPPLFSGPRAVRCVYMYVSCLVAGWSSLAEVFHMLNSEPPEPYHNPVKRWHFAEQLITHVRISVRPGSDTSSVILTKCVFLSA